MNYLNDFVSVLTNDNIPTNSCSMEDLIAAKEIVGDKKLPQAYIEFLQTMGRGTNGYFMVGEDCFIEHIPFLKEGAKEILRGDNSLLEITENDFVFWMGKGNSFCFFKLDEGDNPPIYFYQEGDKEDKFYTINESFSDFLWNRYNKKKPSNKVEEFGNVDAVVDKCYSYSKYLIRKKIINVIGTKFHIYNPNGGLEFYVNKKGFKLKEDIRVYTGEDMTKEVLSIKARNVIDFSATYDVYDSITFEKVGALKRKGMKSILKDEWLIFDKNDFEIGMIKEDSTPLALIRRFLTNLIPQTFIGSVNNRTAFEFDQRFNPFVQKIDLNFTDHMDKLLDKRLGIGAAILLCAIEGRQNN